MIEIQWQIKTNGKHQVWKAKGRAMDTNSLWANAQDTRANPNSWETHLVRKRWDIGLLMSIEPRVYDDDLFFRIYICKIICSSIYLGYVLHVLTKMRYFFIIYCSLFLTAPLRTHPF